MITSKKIVRCWKMNFSCFCENLTNWIKALGIYWIISTTNWLRRFFWISTENLKFLFLSGRPKNWEFAFYVWKVSNIKFQRKAKPTPKTPKAFLWIALIQLERNTSKTLLWFCLRFYALFCFNKIHRCENSHNFDGQSSVMMKMFQF